MASISFYSKDLAGLDFGDWNLRTWLCGKKPTGRLIMQLPNDVMTMVFARSDEVALARFSRVSKKHRELVKVYSEKLFKLYLLPLQLPEQSAKPATAASSLEVISDWALVGENVSAGNSKGFQYTTVGMTPVFPEELRKRVDAMQSVLQKLHAIRVHIDGPKPLSIFGHYHDGNQRSRGGSRNLVTWLASESIRSSKAITDPESREADEAYRALEIVLKLRANVQNEQYNDDLGVKRNPTWFVWKMYGHCGGISVTSPLYPAYKKVVLLLRDYGGWTWETWGRAKTLEDLGIRDGDTVPESPASPATAAAGSAAIATSTMDHKS